MFIAIESYVFVSGAISLMRSELNAQTSDSSTPKKMSALTFGAKKLRAFIGTGNADANNDGEVVDPDVLKSNGDMGVAVTINEMALVVMQPIAASTKSYFALKASGSASLIGVQDVTLNGSLNIDINRGKDSAAPASSPAAINFQASAAASPTTYGDPTGLKVSTGPGAKDFEIIDFTQDTLNVSGQVSLGFSQFVFATGNFAFSRSGDPQSVTLADGSTVSGVSILKVGASHVSVFV